MEDNPKVRIDIYEGYGFLWIDGKMVKEALRVCLDWSGSCENQKVDLDISARSNTLNISENDKMNLENGFTPKNNILLKNGYRPSGLKKSSKDDINDN